MYNWWNNHIKQLNNQLHKTKAEKSKITNNLSLYETSQKAMQIELTKVIAKREEIRAKLKIIEELINKKRKYLEVKTYVKDY